MSRPAVPRASWLQALACATDHELNELEERFVTSAKLFQQLRAPEVGLVMARGRAGGSGAPFNLGEVSVTRCAVRSEAGMVGIGWVQGRRPDRALAIAKLDALFQDMDVDVVAQSVDGLQLALAERRKLVARKAAATKVDFFTLVRGED